MSTIVKRFSLCNVMYIHSEHSITMSTQNPGPSKKSKVLLLWKQFSLKMQVCPLPCSQNVFLFLALAFLSLWVKRNLRGWGALGLTCRIDSFAWTIYSRSTRAKWLPHHRSDGNAVCVWPWLFQVSGIFSFFSSLNVLYHSPLCAIIPKCLYLLFADGEIQKWWPLDILLFLVLLHRHGWADKVKCFYVFDRRGVRL